MNDLTSINQLLGMSMRPILIAIYKFKLRLQLKKIEHHLDSIESNMDNDRKAQRFLLRERITLARELQALNNKT